MRNASVVLDEEKVRAAMRSIGRDLIDDANSNDDSIQSSIEDVRNRLFVIACIIEAAYHHGGNMAEERELFIADRTRLNADDWRRWLRDFTK